MPIRIPDDLPASSILKSENIFTMSETRASHQNIRPLRVLILNLMPKKIETETQLMRLLSNTPLQVDIALGNREGDIVESSQCLLNELIVEKIRFS